MPASKSTLNCIVVDDEMMAREILKSLIEKSRLLDLVGEASNAADAAHLLAEHAVDIVFLDVEMPGGSGFDLLKGFRFIPKVIVTTSHPAYAVDAFDFEVTDFLLKPIDPVRFAIAVDRAIRSIEKISKDHIYIKEENAFVRLDLKDVYYLEAYGDFVKVFLNSGRKVFRAKMKDIEAFFPANFIRVHRSYIVNCDYIERIEDVRIVLKEGNVPIGKTYRDEVKKVIGVV